MLIVKDPTVTVKCRTAIIALFHSLNLCLKKKCNVEYSVKFIYINIF